ncbi:MAG: TetR/AcrR family transcriptional regulator [Parvibaculum sp.]|nr:TetR/AcrR family transcriptional regulator [Parvibaculum sp.]
MTDTAGLDEPEAGTAYSPHIRRKRETRIRGFLQTAMGIIAERGVDGLTLQDVTSAHGISVGAIYRYFPSKDALIAELQRRIVHALSDAIAVCRDGADAWAATAGLDARTHALLRIAVAGPFYASYARDYPSEFGLIAKSLGDQHYLIEDPDARRIFTVSASDFQGLAAPLAEAAEAGFLTPGNALERALVLWAGLHGLAQLRKLNRLTPGLFHVETLIRQLVETLLAGWGAEPAVLAEVYDLIGKHDLGTCPAALFDNELF